MPIKFVIVEYPGIVKNADKALETMGGMYKITKSLTDPEESPLTLTYRPSERFAPVLTGAVNDKPRMLIAKRTVKRHKTTGEIMEERLDFVQPVDRMVTFRELCDFTYSVPASEDLHGVISFLDTISQQRLPLDSAASEHLDQMRKDMLSNPSPLYPPPAFARTAIPFNYRFKQHHSDQFVVDNSTLIRKTGPRKPWELLFTDSQPVSEGAKGADDNDPLSSISAEKLESIRQLFTDQPVWLDKPLIKALNADATFTTMDADMPLDDAETLLVLQHLCYKFVNGPWRHCWIRRGFDPRRTQHALKYQVLTVRRLKNQPSLNPKTGVDIDRLGLYQVCDILHSGLKEVAGHEGCLRDICSEETGWMHQTHVHAIKDAIKFLDNAPTSTSTSSNSSLSLAERLPVRALIESIKADEEVMMSQIASKSSQRKLMTRIVAGHVEKQLNKFRQHGGGGGGGDEDAEMGYELFGQDDVTDGTDDDDDDQDIDR